MARFRCTVNLCPLGGHFRLQHAFHLNRCKLVGLDVLIVFFARSLRAAYMTDVLLAKLDVIDELFRRVPVDRL